MITGITLENFKCFRKVEINPKRITCFVGPNGTGKSSVLQAFGLLKQSAESYDSTIRQTPLTMQGPLVNLNNSWELTASFGQDRPLVAFDGVLKGIKGKDFPFSYSAQITPGIILTPDEEDPEYAYEMLESLTIVSALRGLTRPVYKLGDEFAKDIALKEGIAKQEEQTATNLGHSQSPTGKISGMLKRVTGVGLRADKVPPQSVKVNSVTPSGPVNIVSEGFGTNSLIMLLLQLTTAERGATVMIEEPEIHLHPKAQAELASVLAEVALEEGKQVIMTTHSEHITGRLLTLVAEGTLTPDDVAIYAFEKDAEGVCTATNLNVTPNGTLEGTVNDFFEVNLAEMNRFAQAQFSRLRSEE